MPPSERDSLDDAEFLRLLALARQGDREALGKIWEHVERLLLKIASEDLDPRIRARVAPSDLVQRAYLSVQNGINSFEATQFCNFRNWVQTILRNVMIDESRTQFAEQRDVRKETGIKDGGRSGEVANGQHPVAKSPSPSSHFRKGEEMALLARCLLELSADHRRVIELRVKENLEFQEVGRRMERTTEAAEKLYARGVMALQRALKSHLQAAGSAGPGG